MDLKHFEWFSMKKCIKKKHVRKLPELAEFKRVLGI